MTAISILFLSNTRTIFSLQLVYYLLYHVMVLLMHMLDSFANDKWGEERKWTHVSDSRNQKTLTEREKITTIHTKYMYTWKRNET